MPTKEIQRDELLGFVLTCNGEVISDSKDPVEIIFDAVTYKEE